MTHYANDMIQWPYIENNSGPPNPATVLLDISPSKATLTHDMPQEKSFVSATSWPNGSCRMQNPVLVFLPVLGKARQGMETKSAISTLPEERERERESKNEAKGSLIILSFAPSPLLLQKEDFTQRTPHVHVGWVWAICIGPMQYFWGWLFDWETGEEY